MATQTPTEGLFDREAYTQAHFKSPVEVRVRAALVENMSFKACWGNVLKELISPEETIHYCRILEGLSRVEQRVCVVRE